MKSFSETERYLYNLNPDSLVIDGGGYHGNWFAQMFNLYACNIQVFEPAIGFYCECTKRAYEIELESEVKKIHCFNKGLWATNCELKFRIRGDSTGIFADSGEPETVNVVDIAGVIENAVHVDVLKLNIEGAEYDVIERMCKTGMVKQVDNVQVQFHNNFPGAMGRYKKICAMIEETHESEWDSGFVWQNFRKR